ncbi:amidase domain-containing protein [Paenibacillus sp. P96]|uniref:Amidase domain-containing protein n=1 Tax=Paenibacillus zeirhizosphaerae TaxID=2987519 RepID=A0ABT9FU86_9BACL|nr:amidase domain-containing protein [Paenibacillus sp. P96]MDP4098298.1 amidase domain-containing protein [Paenibacillus sp. P96]
MLNPDWKQALFTYVNQFNRCEVEYSPLKEENVITDLRFLMKRGERMVRMKEWHRERGSTPLRAETRVKPERVIRETETEVVADVLLHVRLFYDKAGMTHQEERVEQERLTFEPEGEQWKVRQVERKVGEQRLSGAEAPFEHASYLQAENMPLLNQSVLGFGTGGRSNRYRREEAAAYAERWWNRANPEFENFEVDCTNFISQCLFAGGAPIHYTGRRESGWWYKGMAGERELWSYSWAVANSLGLYLSSSTWGLSAYEVARPDQLTLGDVILYDWDGNGRFQHSTIVTAFDAGGMPLVNAHTVSARHRYWDYRDSYAWTEKTVYRFYHIADQF